MKVAIDSNIFFFCFKSNREDIKPADVQRTLNHLSQAPKVKLYVPISVIGEIVIECLKGSESRKPGSSYNLEDLHNMIDLWGKLNLAFLYPNELVANVCYFLTKQKDPRLTDTDRVHLCYALAYGMNYLLTADQNLKHCVPDGCKLELIGIDEARAIVAKSKG